MKAIPDRIVLTEDETWPGQKVGTLARLLHMGATMSTLRQMLKVSPRAIRDRMERYNLPPLREATNRQRGSWSEAEIADIRQRREQGQPNAEIIATYGISLSTLNNIRRDYRMDKKDVKFRLGKRISLTYNPLSNEEIDEVCEMWSRGVFTGNILELVNISEQALYRVVKYRGAQRPAWFLGNGAHNWTEAEIEHMRTLAERGQSSTEIADDLGLNWATVVKKAKELGMLLPTQQQIKARNYAKTYAVIDPQVKRCRLAGMTGEEIMQQVGLTPGMLMKSVKRLVEAGEIESRWKYEPWTPKKADIGKIREGYALHLRPVTVALHIGADSEMRVAKIAQDENIPHPCHRFPPLHALRPEVLLHHLFDGRLEKHLEDVLCVYRRSIDAQDVNKALMRFEKARVKFPDFAPWPHPTIRGRANDVRRHENPGAIQIATVRSRIARIEQSVLS